LKMTRLVTLLVAGLLVAPAAQAQSGTFDCNVLDFGIYWFGPGNVSQKAVPGVANPYYVATRPTVIYVHGWQPNTVASRRRETFNYQWNDATYGVNVNMADAWITAGWNIGIFYWNQFGDEGEVKDAEAKIHTNLGPQGMRWRRCDGTYTTAGSPAVSAAQLFYNAITANMASFSGSQLRIAGHSLGSQMAVNVSRLLSDAVTAGRITNTRLRPGRVALLDPFWSSGSKTYLNGRWPGEVARDHVTNLRSLGVIFERYKSSNINDLFIGDSNQPLTTLIGQTELIPGWIPNTSQSARHVAAYNMYFRSFAFSPPPECSTDAFGNRTCGGIAASAKTTDVRTREMMNSTYQWIQTAGTLTEPPNDNMFDRRAR
jgi:uncharacterized protein YjdB